MTETTKKKGGSRASRKFPYFSLRTGIDVAEKVYLRGGGRVSRAQAAELLDVRATSSILEMRLITSVQFGLVKRTDGWVEVTDLGRKIARPASDAEKASALSEAFSSVSLFSQVRGRFQGMPLPDEDGLKNVLLRDFGLPERQKNEAYNLMMNSAREAGILVTRPSGLWFSSLSDGGLTADKVADAGQGEPSRSEEGRREPDRSPVKTFPGALHASIGGLLDDLPGVGADWSPDDRQAWETALSAILDVVYPSSRKPREHSVVGRP